MERCQVCGRKFKNFNALEQHARAKDHKQSECDDGPSVASLMIDAQIDRAMGLPIEDWIADMLPD